MRWVWLVVGVVLVLLGALWTCQGLNLLGQTGGMNGQSIWAVIGLIVVVVGLVVAFAGRRRRR
ncbi:LPXTG cell wall anchor domain-containing protein [Nocardia sp. alder85J]|uniref:LPXTG cell wall anchor domain-containing protein n=1 Tax=Nocardia sp. alder85J TaxID=2862949 RepID=UPI001CD21840|nr:LPXTG cell wall anchor domain-containing protein [Nocardia sp. alder85J]MCX4099056.1 LPXTG cell wall anchor domain-containing protein [Nocardia sp. alder85J]